MSLQAKEWHTTVYIAVTPQLVLIKSIAGRQERNIHCKIPEYFLYIAVSVAKQHNYSRSIILLVRYVSVMFM